MRQYSSDQVEFSWTSLDFKEGLAEGTFLAESRAVPSKSLKSSANGGTVRTFVANKSGTLTATIDLESRLHQKLLAISAQDEKTRDQVFDGRMTDMSSGQVTTYKNTFIMTDPDESRGTDSGTVAWVFGFETKSVTPASGDLNVVGN